MTLFGLAANFLSTPVTSPLLFSFHLFCLWTSLHFLFNLFNKILLKLLLSFFLLLCFELLHQKFLQCIMENDLFTKNKQVSKSTKAQFKSEPLPWNDMFIHDSCQLFSLIITFTLCLCLPSGQWMCGSIQTHSFKKRKHPYIVPLIQHDIKRRDQSPQKLIRIRLIV